MNEYEQRSIILTLYLFLVISLLAAVGIFIASIITDESNTSFASGLTFVLSLAMLWLTGRKQVLVPRLVVPLVVFLLAVYLVISGLGVHDEAIMLFPLAIAVSGLLLGRKGILVYAILSLGAIFIIAFAEFRGQFVTPYSDTVTSMTLITLPILLGVTSLMIYLVVDFLNRALTKSHLDQVALAERNEELESLRSSLESQVIERTAKLEEARHEAEGSRQKLEIEAWQSSAQAELARSISGEQELSKLAATIIRTLCRTLDAQIGALFMAENENLRLFGSYAYTNRKHTQSVFTIGEGLVGQAALERQMIIFDHVPEGYLSASSGLVDIHFSSIVVAPFVFEGELFGVVELGFLKSPTSTQTEFLTKALDTIASAFNTTYTRTQIDRLLMQTQEQAASLQSREEALKAINEELRSQSENLRSSQNQLREQQSVLEATNAELEEQRTALDQQNQELKTAQIELQNRSQELLVANKYKSEFLANMSHELRTPLNSLLILARLLENNEEGNLTSDQVESARIIHQSGSDLLELINEILDLSKVEAGQMTFHFMPMSLNNLANHMHLVFSHMAESKGVPFEIHLEEGLPENIESDQQRVEQIVKNLLSNAFKFTSQGSVDLNIERDDSFVAIRVKDTGIGMTPDQQKRVFEAFQQADGSTSRKYGGTGLGLTISRELAARLGGRIGLESEHGKGSTFTLYLPMKTQPNLLQSSDSRTSNTPSIPISQKPEPNILPGLERRSQMQSAQPSQPEQAQKLPDDRENLFKGDKVLLVIEDDPKFADVLYNHAHKRDFKCLLAPTGEDGLELAKQFTPDAILLDLKLPGINGWHVLDNLKNDHGLRHIPVHILSAYEETLDAYKRGALGFLSKPVDTDDLDGVFHKISEFLAREIKSLLLIEDDDALRSSVRQLLGGSDVKINEAPTGYAALEQLRTHTFDCIILDLTLPDMTGFELLNIINQDENIPKSPVIIYTGQELSERENAELLKYVDSVIIKGIKSPDRLLDETALFLHRVVADLPEEKQRTIQRLHNGDSVFENRNLLVVDDDMRNAFALSRLLGEKGIKVSIARSGQKALEMLSDDSDFDLVLMDIMMPEMDGYETMQRIREQDQFDELPIIALTAKAMKGDRERCLEAGASDYLSKPVDADRLFSMLRVWLYEG